MEKSETPAPKDSCDVLFKRDEQPVLNSICKFAQIVWGKPSNPPVDYYQNRQESELEFPAIFNLHLPKE